MKTDLIEYLLYLSDPNWDRNCSLKVIRKTAFNAEFFTLHVSETLENVSAIVLNNIYILFSKIGEIDFQDSVMTLGFSEELNKLLLQVLFLFYCKCNGIFLYFLSSYVFI